MSISSFIFFDFLRSDVDRHTTGKKTWQKKRRRVKKPRRMWLQILQSSPLEMKVKYVEIKLAGYTSS